MPSAVSLIAKIFVLVLLFGAGIYAYSRESTSLEYDSRKVASTTAVRPLSTSSVTTLNKDGAPVAPEVVITHLATPSPLRGAYMTSCIASGKKLRKPLVDLVDTTELNALIIDIKDFTGMVSFDTGDTRFVINTNGCVIPDIKEFLAELHEKHIYVIGRITVMQDSTFTKSHPDAAVKRKSNGETWRDKKGLSFVDPGASEYWQYMVDLGKTSYAFGFDEINYDYIRYPSDGDMSDAAYLRSASSTKPEMMKKFYSYLGKGMREAGITISADLFGMTTTNTDDLGIGQVLENALLSFDYVAPMVYPSHYPPNFNGWKDPNMVPYPLIKYVMTSAVERANELEAKDAGWKPVLTVVSSTTGVVSTSTNSKFVPTGKYARRLRPWLQDFDYGKNYEEVDVRAQIKGTYDSGLDSWMMWDPSNKYTPSAYDRESPAPSLATSTLRENSAALLP